MGFGIPELGTSGAIVMECPFYFASVLVDCIVELDEVRQPLVCKSMA